MTTWVVKLPDTADVVWGLEEGEAFELAAKLADSGKSAEVWEHANAAWKMHAYVPGVS